MTPEQTAIVARRTVEGVPIRTIAAELGTTHPSVIRAKKKPEVRQWIEDEIANLMTKGLKPARRTLCRLAAMGTTKGQDKDTLALALKASQTILQHANGQPGTIINTLIQIHQDPEHQAELTNVERFLQMEAWKGESIDVTPSHTPAHVQSVNIPGNGDAGEAGQEVGDADMGVSLGVSGNMLDDGP